jgi:hypothetical protein
MDIRHCLAPGCLRAFYRQAQHHAHISAAASNPYTAARFGSAYANPGSTHLYSESTPHKTTAAYPYGHSHLAGHRAAHGHTWRYGDATGQLHRCRPAPP